MGWLFDVLGISVDGFVSSIFNGIINWIYEVIFSVIKVVFTKNVKKAKKHYIVPIHFRICS